MTPSSIWSQNVLEWPEKHVKWGGIKEKALKTRVKWSILNKIRNLANRHEIVMPS